MHWIIPKTIDENFKNSFPEYSSVILQLLSNRKLTTQKEIDEFFNPDYDRDLHNPFLMKGVREAVDKIRKVIKEKGKIFVYGDYDADGVTATAVIIKTLIFLGAAEPGVYIPDRAKEGYGLKKAAVEYIKNHGADLVITVDCGVANFKEVDFANSLGLEVIVTDHHWVPENLPKAISVINPKQQGDEYPYKNLAGVGVAFKLAQALLRTDDGEISAENKKFEKWLLDLVAIGTVADSVPLLGENRTLVKYGLIVLSKTKNVGLNELMKKANVKETDKDKADIFDDSFCISDKAKFSTGTYKTDSFTIAFQLAPRLNAAGRMDHANTAYKLLVTESKEEANELVNSIEKQNRSRQTVTEKAVSSIRERLLKNKIDRVIFEGDKGLPVGILGLIASKLCDEFSRPTFVYSKGEKESAGSGRSIDSFNLIEAISGCKELLLEFGGHKGAAGFKISNKNLESFAKLLNKKGEAIKDEDLISSIMIDSVLIPQDFDWSLWEDILKLVPFGEENPEPLFVMKNLTVEEIRRVGSAEKHFKFSFKSLPKGEDEKRFQAIAFNFDKFTPALNINDKVDVAFNIISNTWNGFSKLEMKVVDVKKI